MPDDLPPDLPPSDGPDPSADGDGPAPLLIEDELKDSYLTYAMSVIVNRALPDVRDGLKPSQRRILLAMNDLNLGPTASTSKCAGIVGETMKRYHPHGDNSIYPTLVRMAQDWNMRHRLVHPQGNFGSIQGLPPAAMRYCVAGDTLIHTVSGLRRIDEIASVEPNSEVDLFLEVFNSHGDVVVASKLFHSGDHPTLRLRTDEGHELVGTLNHPVLCLENGGAESTFQWRLMQDVTPGTWVVRIRGTEPLSSSSPSSPSSPNSCLGTPSPKLLFRSEGETEFRGAPFPNRSLGTRDERTGPIRRSIAAAPRSGPAPSRTNPPAQETHAAGSAAR